MHMTKTKQSLLHIFCAAFLSTAALSAQSAFVLQGQKRAAEVRSTQHVFPMDALAEKESYFPFAPLSDATITLPVSFVVITDTAQDQGLHHGEDTRASFRKVIDEMNTYYAQNTPPIDDIPGREFVEDIGFRVRLADTYIFDDPELYEFRQLAQLYQRIYERIPAVRNTVVIVCNRFLYSGAWGWSSTVRVPDESVPGFIIQTLNVDDEYFQGVEDQYAQHWVHELNHLFGLGHVYSGSAGTESCDPSHPDYLSDVFGTQPQEWCEKGRGRCVACYYTGEHREQTNNIMSGNSVKSPASAAYYSPMQIARLHRQLTIAPIGTISEGYSPDKVLKIARSDTLQRDLRLHQDIYLPRGVTWVVKSDVSMSTACAIYVEAGALLIVDGGSIHPASFRRYATWGGVRMMREGTERGMIRLLNGASIRTSSLE